MSGAKNNAQLRRILLPMIQKAVEYAMEQVYYHNQGVIDRIVYGAYDPSVYERTYEFREAWVAEPNDRSGKAIHGSTVSMKFGYSPDDIYTVDPPIHGSILDNPRWKDARDYLADIIYQGKSGPLYGTSGPWLGARDAWSELMRELESGKFHEYLETGFQKAGLQLK